MDDKNRKKHEDLQSAFNKSDIMNKWKINVLPQTIINNFWELLLLFLLSLYQEKCICSLSKVLKNNKSLFRSTPWCSGYLICSCFWSEAYYWRMFAIILLHHLVLVYVSNRAIHPEIAIGYARNLQRKFFALWRYAENPVTDNLNKIA